MKAGNYTGVFPDHTLKNILISEPMPRGGRGALNHLRNILIIHQESWQVIFQQASFLLITAYTFIESSQRAKLCGRH